MKKWMGCGGERGGGGRERQGVCGGVGVLKIFVGIFVAMAGAKEVSRERSDEEMVLQVFL
jgi:hypothetical protein